MLADRTKATKHLVWAIPSSELHVDDLSEFGQRGEVAVVKPEFAQELPNAFDRVELRAVGRKEQERKIWFLQLPPFGVERSVMVFGVIDKDRKSVV